MPIYSIGAVAKLLAVPASTLRAWEQRYSLITPARSAGSQRLYSPEQLEHLRFITARLRDGASAAEAHRLLAEHLAGSPASQLSERDAKLGPTILVVERDPYAAGLMEQWLRGEGYEVIVVMGADKAWSEFDSRRPEVVLIDLLVSGGAGFRLLRQMAVAGWAQIVALSPTDNMDEASNLGAAAFLHKPLDPFKLLSTVRGLTRPAIVAVRLKARGVVRR